MDSWESITAYIDFYANHQTQFKKYNGPGMWLDPDMLVLGNFGLSYDQQKAQFAFWCMWSSPLYMSNDLREVKPEIKAILQNKHLIAVNQDPLGIMATRVEKQVTGGNFEVWVKQMTPVIQGRYSFAILYFNRQPLGQPMIFTRKLKDILTGDGLDGAIWPPHNYPTVFDIYDLFDDGKKLGRFNITDNLSLKVNPSGGVAMVKAVPVVD